MIETARNTALFLLLGALASSSLPSSVEAAETLGVRPGTVVRWPGDDLESCALGERHWSPRSGACWYPIDLLATGAVEVVRERDGRRETRRLEVGDYPYDVQRLTIADDSQVHLSAADLARVERESARIGALWTLDGAPRFELPLAAPLASMPPGGRFGARRIINGEPRSPHTGSDFAADRGTPVLAVAAGRVALAEEYFFSGNSVFLDHGDGLISMYFHLSEIDVEPGQEVERGQRLGLVGSTGRATGPHLHFGLRWHGARIDPALLMASPATVPTIQ